MQLVYPYFTVTLYSIWVLRCALSRDCIVWHIGKNGRFGTGFSSYGGGLKKPKPTEDVQRMSGQDNKDEQ